MSLAFHYWMGDVHHCSRAPISEMTCTVSSGTLNSSIPYHTILLPLCHNLPTAEHWSILQYTNWWPRHVFEHFISMRMDYPGTEPVNTQLHVRHSYHITLLCLHTAVVTSAVWLISDKGFMRPSVTGIWVSYPRSQLFPVVGQCARFGSHCEYAVHGINSS